MKKFIKPFVILFSAMLVLSSCGVNNHLSHNVNNTNTQVELTKKNFKVIEKVSATVEVDYVLCFGGRSKTSLAEMAKAKLYEEAGLEGKSRAIINITIEDHFKTIIGIVSTRTVTASGYVIEFTD